MNPYMTRLPLAIAMASALALTAGCNNRTADDRAATQSAADPAAQTTPGSGMGDGRDSNQPVDDTWITTKVKSSLLADTDVAGLDIEVETVNGVVTLSGNVDQQSQIDHAARIARDTEGVTDVRTTALTVGPRNR